MNKTKNNLNKRFNEGIKVKVLMSIHPEYVKKIIKNEKKYEFRRNIFKKDVDEIIVYSTKPTKKIECTLEINNIIKETPNILWDKCGEFGGISKKKFFEYFENKKDGYAIEIKKVNILEPSLTLEDINQNPPQSFIYISQKEYQLINNNKKHHIQ